MRTKTFFIITIIVLTTVILMQNMDAVRFKILVWDLYLPKLVILTGAVFIGIITGLLLGVRTKTSSNYQDQKYSENPRDTLSAEDRDYIS